MAAVAILLGLVAFAAAHSEPRLSEVPVEPEPLESVLAPSEPAEERPPGEPAEPVRLPGWLGTLAGGLCVALTLAAVAIGLVFALRDRLRRQARPVASTADPLRRPDVNADEVVAAVEAGLSALDDADADPRRAVIACWVRLEEAAAAAGTPRHPADTPTDLVTRLLADHAVSADVLAGFAAVYRAARYASHAVDGRMRAQARDALRRLRGELTVAAGDGP